MVKFETRFNRETTKSINNLAFKKLRWMFVIVPIALIAIGVMGIIYGINYPGEGDFEAGICLVIFGVIFVPLIYVLTHFAQKKLDKSMSLLSDDTHEKFEFSKDKIQIETVKSDMYTSNVTTTYKYLYRIVEDKDTFYLYISKVQCHVIQKKYLTEGTYEELIEYFKANFNCVKTSSNQITYKNK